MFYKVVAIACYEKTPLVKLKTSPDFCPGDVFFLRIFRR